MKPIKPSTSVSFVQFYNDLRRICPERFRGRAGFRDEEARGVLLMSNKATNVMSLTQRCRRLDHTRAVGGRYGGTEPSIRARYPYWVAYLVHSRCLYPHHSPFEVRRPQASTPDHRGRSTAIPRREFRDFQSILGRRNCPSASIGSLVHLRNMGVPVGVRPTASRARYPQVAPNGPPDPTSEAS